jgi:hypothetical protein
MRPQFRYRRHDASVFLYAFDLIELNRDDLRRDPLEVREATLASTLAKAGPSIRLAKILTITGPARPMSNCSSRSFCPRGRRSTRSDLSPLTPATSTLPTCSSRKQRSCVDKSCKFEVLAGNLESLSRTPASNSAAHPRCPPVLIVSIAFLSIASASAFDKTPRNR